MVLWGIFAALAVLTLGWFAELPIDYGVPPVAVLAGIALSFFCFLLPRNLKKLSTIFAIGKRLDGKDYSLSANLAVVAAVLIVYTLSVGPAAAITKKGWLSNSTFKLVYAPILWLDDHTLLKNPIEAYVKLWGLP